MHIMSFESFHNISPSDTIQTGVAADANTCMYNIIPTIAILHIQ